MPEWDTVPRVDTLFIDYLGAKDNTYVRAATRKTICAAITRVKNPGCKFDTMPVLNGPQGIGKSTLIAKLAGEWFSDSLNLGDTKDKTAAEKLQGYWILEIGELAGLRKAETETLRSFISRQNDIYRAAFGKRATPHPRQCIFFGTTNAESGYLRDTTGNRRFWPIKTPGNGKKRSWELTEYDILQIWAEAMVYVEQGEKLYLPPEIEALAKNEQREALEADEREGLVQDFLDALLPENWDKMDTYERRNFLEGTGVGGIGQIGTVKRMTVSNMEIWCEYAEGWPLDAKVWMNNIQSYYPVINESATVNIDKPYLGCYDKDTPELAATHFQRNGKREIIISFNRNVDGVQNVFQSYYTANPNKQINSTSFVDGKLKITFSEDLAPTLPYEMTVSKCHEAWQYIGNQKMPIEAMTIVVPGDPIQTIHREYAEVTVIDVQIRLNEKVMNYARLRESAVVSIADVTLTLTPVGVIPI